jgi:hypothetical protein
MASSLSGYLEIMDSAAAVPKAGSLLHWTIAEIGFLYAQLVLGYPSARRFSASVHSLRIICIHVHFLYAAQTSC